MALSLSGDDEEYDSESEQVRPLTFHYVTSLFVSVCLSKCAGLKKAFSLPNCLFLLHLLPSDLTRSSSLYPDELKEEMCLLNRIL